IAGEAEERWKREDDQRRRKGKPAGPPHRLGAKPSVRRIAPQLWRVKRRQVRAKGVMRILKRRPGSVDNETPENQENNQRLHPPCIVARRFAKGSDHGQARRCGSHAIPLGQEQSATKESAAYCKGVSCVDNRGN